MTTEAWGPLAKLIGDWEGAEGVDVSFHNAKGRVGETRYRERVTMAPFGPVENGTQKLWGLDYRMEAFREGETSAFHTEIGYWLWDAEAGHVLRCFMVPRGVTVLAQANAKPTDTRFTLEATLGHATFGVLSNAYLAEKAKTTKYVCKVVLEEGTFAYESCTTYHHHAGGEIAHTDRNVLRRV
jgi:hypothetical protein